MQEYLCSLAVYKLSSESKDGQIKRRAGALFKLELWAIAPKKPLSVESITTKFSFPNGNFQSLCGKPFCDWSFMGSKAFA